MKLSPKEGIVLAAAELRSTAPISALRRGTGLREHTVRHALHRLKQRGVCVSLPFINMHRLGFSTVVLFFTISAPKRSTHQALLKMFASTPEVVWVAEFGGEYQYGVAICTKHFPRAMELIASLSAQFHNIFFAKAVSVQYGATVFGRGYLTAKRPKVAPITVRVGGTPVEIDQTDMQVLERLATPGDRSNRDIARELGMPASTVDLRLKRLHEKGVIAGNILSINCTLFGFQQYKLLIYSRGLNPQISQRLHTFCERSRNVTYLIESLGEWDYEIGVEVGSNEEVSLIMQELFDDFGSDLSTIKVLTKFRDLKYRWFPG